MAEMSSIKHCTLDEVEVCNSMQMTVIGMLCTMAW